MVGFHNLLLKWMIVQCVQYDTDTILEYQWPVALYVAYHETYDKKMSLFICCATLSRLLVLLYRWRSGQTFTPGFSKDVKFVRAFLFLQNEPIKRKMFVFLPGKPRYQWFFISNLIHSWDFSKDTMPIPPSLVVYNAALSACAEATEWQHALQQLRDLGSKLKNLGVVSQCFFFMFFSSMYRN